MSHYVISPKRGHKASIPSGWQKTVQDTEGLRVVGKQNARRLRVDASEPVIEAIKSQFDDQFHIEPLIEHGRLPAPGE